MVKSATTRLMRRSKHWRRFHLPGLGRGAALSRATLRSQMLFDGGREVGRCVDRKLLTQ